MEAIRFMCELQRPGGMLRARNSSASQAGAPARSGRAGSERRRARDPPAHPRAAEIGVAAQPNRQPATPRPLRSDGKPPRRGEVERARVAPQFADHAGERAHLSPSSIAHSASRASRASTWMRSWPAARRMDPPAFQDRHPLLHPQQRLVRVELREQEPRPAAVARMRGEQFGQGGALAGIGEASARAKAGRGSGERRTPPPAALAPSPQSGEDDWPARSARRQLRRRPGTSLLPHNSQRFCSAFVLVPRLGAGVNGATRRRYRSALALDFAPGT